MITFDIVDGTTVIEFLKEISCDGLVSSRASDALIQNSLNAIDYYIRTYPPTGGEGRIELFDLTWANILTLLSQKKEIDKGQGNIINQESMIFKHKP